MGKSHTALQIDKLTIRWWAPKNQELLNSLSFFENIIISTSFLQTARSQWHTMHPCRNFWSIGAWCDLWDIASWTGRPLCRCACPCSLTVPGLNLVAGQNSLHSPKPIPKIHWNLNLNDEVVEWFLTFQPVSVEFGTGMPGEKQALEESGNQFRSFHLNVCVTLQTLFLQRCECSTCPAQLGWSSWGNSCQIVGLWVLGCASSEADARCCALLC